MGKRRTPEEQNALIKRMTSQWKDAPFPLPRGKVQPTFCEHCDHTMTKTGRLPALADRGSWAHWVRWEVGEHGVQKIHTAWAGAAYGQCCVACFKAYQQWEKEYDAEEGAA